MKIIRRFRQHIPCCLDYKDAIKIPIYSFETLEEMMALEVVQRYRESEDYGGFEISGNYLMMVSEDRYHWWVVGTIDITDGLELPIWKARNDENSV